VRGSELGLMPDIVLSPGTCERDRPEPPTGRVAAARMEEQTPPKDRWVVWMVAMLTVTWPALDQWTACVYLGLSGPSTQDQALSIKPSCGTE
jgi:hypothetical protein